MIKISLLKGHSYIFTRFLLLIFFILFLMQTDYPQVKKRHILGHTNIDQEYISIEKLINDDFDNLLELDKDVPVNDSIKTLNWQGKLWFLFKSKDDNCLELFNTDRNNGIIKVTNRCFNIKDNRLFTIKSFNNKMFVTTNFSEKENVWNLGMLLIDHENDKEEKYILVKEKSFLTDMYIENDSLYVVAQPNKAKVNPLYYLTFWMKRERPEKYHFINDGNPEIFVYDGNFNLVRKQKVPGYKKD